jgi:mRNA-degrading endonuclease RelE of RelBE toxin-antitoxin system
VTPTAGHRWTLDLRPRAERQLSRLPEKVAAAAVEFILGALLENPYRVGHALRGEYTGQHSARRGHEWRVRYRIDSDTHTVTIFDVSHRSDTYGI